MQVGVFYFPADYGIDMAELAQAFETRGFASPYLPDLSRGEILRLLDNYAPWPQRGKGRHMIREELVFVATCDISGHVRGKGFPARELPGAAQKGHRLDRQQSDDVAGRADLGHALRHRRRSDDRARPGGRGAGRFRRRLGDRAFLSRRHLHHRRRALGNAARAISCAAPRASWRRRRACTSSPPSSRNLSIPAPTTARATPMRSAPFAARAVSARRLSPPCAPPARSRTVFSPNTGRASSR